MRRIDVEVDAPAIGQAPHALAPHHEAARARLEVVASFCNRHVQARQRRRRDLDHHLARRCGRLVEFLVHRRPAGQRNRCFHLRLLLLGPGRPRLGMTAPGRLQCNRLHDKREAARIRADSRKRPWPASNPLFVGIPITRRYGAAPAARST
ncbi:hypothetical protein CBM2634_A80019 [Cupriavidus taiwanensis]|uniref:Uncharacterized protein n=1 Tax=Cupriavidus taiwanensis TaxID=164546 RepID=A0A375J1T8_9BURK|nr:hypothetical protein CBM2634_A80019 [Cupriavidus taiwanensis]